MTDARLAIITSCTRCPNFSKSGMFGYCSLQHSNLGPETIDEDCPLPSAPPNFELKIMAPSEAMRLAKTAAEAELAKIVS